MSDTGRHGGQFDDEAVLVAARCEVDLPDQTPLVVALGIVDRLLDRIEGDGIADPDEVDLAFGVSRFEDFAGFERNSPRIEPRTMRSSSV